MRTLRLTVVIVTVLLVLAYSAKGQPLSIYEIQYTTDPNGDSPHNGNIVDCLGGIVIHKSPPSTRPKLTLYDPNNPDGWGGIMVKDLLSTGDFDSIELGDWIALTSVLVEEFKGTTYLQYTPDNDAAFTIITRNNPAPRPLLLTADQIAAPVQGPDHWTVADRSAEKYEAMLVKVFDVSVADTGYGKAADNYVLESNSSPGSACWGSDYMNIDNEEIYHAYVQVGQSFCGVAGIIEQYTGEKSGVSYDYYQLLTLDTDSFTIDQPADLDDNCGVDMVDFSLFARHWVEDGCSTQQGCAEADLTQDGTVDNYDLFEFSQYWLEGK